MSCSAELLAVGSYDPRNVKTEIYLTEESRWKTVEDYPTDYKDEIHSYAVLYHDGAFYLFGGKTFWESPRQTIARLDTRNYMWSEVGCPS